jgi:hypothetical protein
LRRKTEWGKAGRAVPGWDTLCKRPIALPALTLPSTVVCRDILAIPETRADWWQFFGRHLAPRLAAGTLKLSLVNSDCWGS